MKQVAYRDFSPSRGFGVEMEVNGIASKAAIKRAIVTVSPYPVVVSNYAQSIDNMFWHVKDDATCGESIGRGHEIATPIGRTADAATHFGMVADTLAAAGVRVNDRCGLHVHVGANDLDIPQVAGVVAHWVKVQFYVGLVVSPRRINPPQDRYCRMLYPTFRTGNADDFWEAVRPKNLSPFGNEERWKNLNLVNFARALKNGTSNKKTLEFRWPEGTLCGRDVVNWVRLFVNFVENCKDRSMPAPGCCSSLEDALEILGLHHGAGTFHILGPALLDTKRWFLNRILANWDIGSIRRDSSRLLRLLAAPRDKV